MSQRQKLLDLIAVNVRAIAKRGSLVAFRQLEKIEDLTGCMTNRSMQTNEQLAEAIIAFAAIAARRDLINTAHGAVFYRHMPSRGRQQGDWERANKLADDALRTCGVDVDALNARDKRDEERQREWARRQLAKRAA